MPPNKLTLTLPAADIASRTSSLIAETKALYDKVGALPTHQCTFETVCLPLALQETRFETSSASLTFLQHVSPVAEVREASEQAERLLQEFGIESEMRQDLFNAVRGAKENTDLSKLGPEDIRLLEKLELDFRRNGLGLPEDKREELKNVKKQLSELSISFSRNIAEDKSYELFTKDELDGLPEDFLSGLQKEGEKFKVTTKYPEIFPVLMRAKNEETRRKMEFLDGSRVKDNVQLLEQAIKLRRKAAELLGYKNHGYFRLEVRMAKTPENVAKFLDELIGKLKPGGLKEIDELKQLKREEKELAGLPFDDKINAWDFRYYNRMLLEKKYQVDDEKIKEYFSLEAVTEGMLKLYEGILGLRFVDITVSSRAELWHEDVRMFEVWDAAGISHEDGGFMGHFYLDLHPREGKYTHAACFGLQPGCADDGSGKRQWPAAAMVANFSKPTPGRPSLLKHNEVVTYFHELGHVMHQLCSRVKYARFHGTSVERDVVEMPSQGFENWCWETDVLGQLSNHYERKDEKIPAEVVDRMVAAKNLNIALLTLRQTFFAKVDFLLHTSEDENVDSTKLWSDLRGDITLIPSTPGTFPAATFGHIMGGYDVGYYGYLYSQVFSADIFYSRFKKEGVHNSKTGLEFRVKILGPGGSKDGDDFLRDFLGRDPTPDAFLQSIGL